MKNQAHVIFIFQLKILKAFANEIKGGSVYIFTCSVDNELSKSGVYYEVLTIMNGLTNDQLNKAIRK